MWFQNVWRWVGSGAPRVKVYRRSAVVSFANHANADATCWISFFANEAIEAQHEVKKTRRVLIAPYGDWPNTRGLQRFAREDAQKIVNEFSSVAKRALNPASWLGLPWYEGHPDHPDFRGKSGHTRSTAVGRIKSLEAGNDGLYADVKFNEDGEKLIVNESYHGHSVNWYLREDKNGALKKAYRPFSLKSVGFTNEPNIPVPAVTTANAESDSALRFTHMAKLRANGLMANGAPVGNKNASKEHLSKQANEAGAAYNKDFFGQASEHHKMKANGGKGESANSQLAANTWSDAARKAALEARHGHATASKAAYNASDRAKELSAKAIAAGEPTKHIDAAEAHLQASALHTKAEYESAALNDRDSEKEHGIRFQQHVKAEQNHRDSAMRLDQPTRHQAMARMRRGADTSSPLDKYGIKGQQKSVYEAHRNKGVSHEDALSAAKQSRDNP